MSKRSRHLLITGTALVIGIAGVIATLAVPVLLLLRANEQTLNRWSLIGQAVQPVGVFFSGIAFIAIAWTLYLQRGELQNQRADLNIALEEQKRSSEIAIRAMHTDLIKMAIEDPELGEVWPQVSPGVAETKKDHYCNLILNLQKVAYETGTIELDELRGALHYLMVSPDMYSFWAKARAARLAVTAGDQAEDAFTAEIDEAFATARPAGPRAPRPLVALLRNAISQWRTERVSRGPTK